MKMIQVPKEVKLLPSKPNEKLVDVKTYKFGDITRVKYSTATPRVSFDGIRTAPAQVKMMPPRETLKRSALAPLDREGKRQRTTIAALEKRVDTLAQTVGGLHERINLLSKTLDSMHMKLELERIEQKNLQTQINILTHCLGEK